MTVEVFALGATAAAACLVVAEAGAMARNIDTNSLMPVRQASENAHNTAPARSPDNKGRGR